MPDLLQKYTGCYFQSEILSKEQFKYLIEGQGFSLDDLEWDDSKISDLTNLLDKWKKDVDPVTIEELTIREVGGSGVFDAIMESVHNHLKREYDSGRIIGSEYVTAYVQLTEASLTQAVRFAIDKNKAYWDAIAAQAQAIVAGIEAQIATIRAKVEFYRIKAEALKVAADFSLTTMKIATEDAQHALLCSEKIHTEAQTGLVREQTNTQIQQTELVHQQGRLTGQQYLTEIQRTDLTEKQVATEDKQPALVQAQTDLAGAQKLNVDQDTAVKEQQEQVYEHQAISTDPDLNDGRNVEHLLKAKNIEVLGSQAGLYIQQADSYKKNDERKVAELFSSTYTAMKAIDEGFPIPQVFRINNIESVIRKCEENVGYTHQITET